jgi:hypothetical protein
MILHAMRALLIGALLAGAVAVPAVAWAVAAVDAVAADDREGDPMDLLFIHHSTGGTLLADPGEQVGGERGSGERCLYQSHPQGGGLRSALEARGLQVNQLTYESKLGEDTDFCHWRRKFAGHMDRLLRTQRQDTLLPEGRTNQIVAFKSCFPNNWLIGRGTEPGDPDDCTRTLANAKAAYRSLLPLFREQPDVLFVAVTPPPMIAYEPVGLKATIENWFEDNGRGGELARELNTWMIDREHGWLAEYDLPNVVVFDYWNILTGEGESNYLVYPIRRNDSHPAREGNQKAAAAFVPFLEEALAGMGWTWPSP